MSSNKSKSGAQKVREKNVRKREVQGATCMRINEMFKKKSKLCEDDEESQNSQASNSNIGAEAAVASTSSAAPQLSDIAGWTGTTTAATSSTDSALNKIHTGTGEEIENELSDSDSQVRAS